MTEIRGWLSRIVCFLCLMHVLLHVIPDNSLKKYVRFFLEILFLLVALEPVGSFLGMEDFLANFELESLRGLRRDLDTGAAGLEGVLPGWDEESYQRELEEKIRKICEKYHIPMEEVHTNYQETGDTYGENGAAGIMETGGETEKGSDYDRDTGGNSASGDRPAS